MNISGGTKWNQRLTKSTTLERIDGLLDNVRALVHLCLGHDQWRCESDDISVSGLSQQSIITQPQTHLPRVQLFNHDRIQQSLAPHNRHHLLWQLIQLSSQPLSHPGSILCQLLVHKDIQSSHCNFAAQRISSVCRSVLSWFDGQHDRIIGQNCSHGVHATTQRFAQD